MPAIIKLRYDSMEQPGTASSSYVKHERLRGNGEVVLTNFVYKLSPVTALISD